MNLSEKLLTLRKEKGLSQEELAAQISVSRQAISRWEVGDTLPDVENLLALSRVFGVSTDFLLRDDVPVSRRRDEDMSPREKDFQPHWNPSRPKTPLVLGVVFGSIGAVGIAVLWVLSTMTEVYYIKKSIVSGVSHYEGVMGYQFWGFLSAYRLYAVFFLLLVCLVFGVALLCLYWKSRKAPGDGKQ